MQPFSHHGRMEQWSQYRALFFPPNLYVLCSFCDSIVLSYCSCEPYPKMPHYHPSSPRPKKSSISPLDTELVCPG